MPDKIIKGIPGGITKGIEVEISGKSSGKKLRNKPGGIPDAISKVRR